MSRAARQLIERLTRRLGPAVATPEWVTYREFRWCCPACRGGDEDPDGIYRPLVADSDGRLWCDAPYCSPEELAATIRTLLRAAT